MEIFVGLVWCFLATVVISRACDGFESAADYLGRNMTEGVKGATINAVGSSMPELCTTFVFLFMFRDVDGFAGGIGTTAGSAVFNSMIIPAAVIISVVLTLRIETLNVSKKVILRDGLMLILADAVLIFLISNDTLYWWHGMILIMMYCGYAWYMLWNMNKGNSTDATESDEKDEEPDKPEKSKWIAIMTLDLDSLCVGNNGMGTSRAWVLLATATMFIAGACHVLVYGCDKVGKGLGIPIYFVAVVLAAAASSVPDTILSIKDAKKGNYDDAISNAFGSNIFDICFALGAPLFLYCLIYGKISMNPETVANVIELLILLLVLTIGSFLIFYIGTGLRKAKAYGLLALYGLFILFIAGKAFHHPIAIQIAEALHRIYDFIPRG